MKKTSLMGLFLAGSMIFTSGCQADKNLAGLEDSGREEEELQVKTIDDLDLSKVEFINYESIRDEEIEMAIKTYMDKDELGRLEYFYNSLDLNNDGREEKIVYLIGEYVSGTGGSTTLILDEDYNLINDISLTRTPMIVDKNRTNGWNDLIMMVAGGGGESQLVRLEFDGEGYPRNPSVEAALGEDRVEGVEILGGEVELGRGAKIN